jgi:hypothetical protein
MIAGRSTVAAVIAGLTLGALAGLSAFFAWPMLVQSKALTPPSHPKFAEVRWPFPTDEWGEGKAFRCEKADCGVEVNVYIRAKIGFCNCLTGVSDDNELDRLSDFNLMDGKPSVLGPGHEINIAWMKGRSRALHRHRALSRAKLGAGDCVQRSLRCGRRNGDHRSRCPEGDRAQRHRIPQQRGHRALG